MPLSKITNPFLDPAGSARSNVYSPSANTIAITTATTERVRVDSNGNMGIGTTSPSDTSLFTRALDLNGTSGAAYYARTNGSSTNYTVFGNFGADGYINNRGSGNIQFYNNNIERMRIDSSGSLTMPYQPAFMAYRTAGAVSGTGIYICNIVTFNDGSHYNSSTGRFTAPVAGRYQLNFFVLMQNGNNVDFHIRVNGTQYAGMDIRDNNGLTGNFTLSCSAVLKLSASDIVDPYIAFQGAGSIYGSGLNGFSMYFLG